VRTRHKLIFHFFFNHQGQKRHYYYHRATKKVQWMPPTEWHQTFINNDTRSAANKTGEALVAAGAAADDGVV
jgi:hypothetical protein|tara:strand:+ start:42 stop:257 length:216 start_codon:yes stop_codon:yes gene_type:complete